MIFKQSTACMFVILWVIYLFFVRRNKRVVDYAQFQESDDAGKLL